MTVPLVDLVPEIHIHAAKAPYPAIFRAIRQAATDICKRAEAWRYSPPVMTVVEGVHEYVVKLPEDAVIHKIIRGSLDEVPLTLTSEILLDQKNSRWKTDKGLPTNIFLNTPTKLSVAPTPDQTYSVALDTRLSLMPSFAATSLPTDLVEKYHQTIVDGALSYLLLQNGMLWSNPQLGSVYSNSFESTLESIIATERGDDTRKPRTVVYGGL